MPVRATPAPRTSSRASRHLCRFELLAAVRAAEVVRDSVQLELLARGRDRHRHPADRIDRLFHELRRRGAAGVLPGNTLREDRDRDLLLRGGPEIEPGGTAKSREPPL